MGDTAPHSRQAVTGNWAAQYGQTAPDWKVSKGRPHWRHFQSSPAGGGVLHLGQANPSRRGNLAKRDKASAWRSPPQQFNNMKAARTANQMECAHKARTMNPATPMKPRIVATIRLRARPRRKPEQGAKNLAAIQGIDGQNVENQQENIDEPDRAQQLVEIRHGRGPTELPVQNADPRDNGNSTTFTSGPATMLHSVAPGRGGGFT